MPTVTDMFPSKYLSAKEEAFTINGRPNGKNYTVTISHILQEDMGEGEQKWVVYFTETQKAMVLNRTVANTCEWLFGGDTDAWVGKKVVLFAEMTSMMGKPCAGLRLRGVDGAQPSVGPTSLPNPGAAGAIGTVGSASLPTPNPAGAATMSTPLSSTAPGTIQPITPGNHQAPLDGNGPGQNGPPPVETEPAGNGGGTPFIDKIPFAPMR